MTVSFEDYMLYLGLKECGKKALEIGDLKLAAYISRELTKLKRDSLSKCLKEVEKSFEEYKRRVEES